ncbi:hypothetical protein IAG44_41480 [Streptomyces roseirectus]|uniref:Uncharacterized protein n=1 Tax=Streptomyces roseirectus TaxID=2768066 RepID=A0A7H0IR30_9ACTN|nr:hypothetical protein [Streptomyces roseirectus]QNP75246.1 hypothetical protein IAG44_41480 [Streptomyces roseirectus]
MTADRTTVIAQTAEHPPKALVDAPAPLLAGEDEREPEESHILRGID